MKLFVVLAFLGVIDGRSFCNTEQKDKALGIAALIELKTSAILGHCEDAQNAAFSGDDAFYGDDCGKMFEEGYCFAKEMIEEYGPEEGETCTEKRDITYMQMANFADTDVRPLGNVVCEHGRTCLKRLRDKLRNCSTDVADFYEIAYANLKIELEAFLTPGYIKTFMKDTEAMLSCRFNADDYVLCLFQAVKEEFMTYSDIEDFVENYLLDFVNDYINQETKDKLTDDATGLIDTFLTKAETFCTDNCVCRSVNFFKRLFEQIHDEETCPNTDVYCEGCASNADDYLRLDSTTVPCCTRNTLNSIMAAFTYGEEEYGALITEMKEAILSDLDANVPDCAHETAYNDFVTSVSIEAECLNTTQTIISEMDCSDRKRCRRH